MYLPNELWSKIWLYTAIVDTKRKELLCEIRKSKIKILLEKIYFQQWGDEYYDWLYNDIYGWINDDKPTLFQITDKMISFYKREFNVNVNSIEDIEIIEKNNLGIQRKSKFLWSLYTNKLTEKELFLFKENILNNIPRNFISNIP